MKILYIEPFYSGAHQQWIDSYAKNSKHQITILSLPGRKWKWRMHGAAITLSDKFNNLNNKFDLIICSDMLNLPVFKSLCENNIANTKLITYFHENQLSYPWSLNDADTKINRDLHYGYINYTSSLISDFNFFNSNYHLKSYLNELKIYLSKMPDWKNLHTLDIIKNKSEVLYIGCELEQFQLTQVENSIPIILWNHRWEYDKNPELFFKTLGRLKKNNIRFKLVVLGESYKNSPRCFEEAKIKFKNEILHFGFCESIEEYKKWLLQADVLPITSIQDFFGVSIIEAVASNVYPLLPNRLSYPEILDFKNHKELFYESDEQLYDKLYNYLNNYKILRKSIIKYRNFVNRFSWKNIVETYDKKFEKIC